MRLEFHPKAERELIEAALYYEVEVPGLGKRFGKEVERIAAILLAPGAGASDRLGASAVHTSPISVHNHLQPII